MTMNEDVTFGSVCDGIGCGHLAFVMEGGDCLWSSEIEAFPSDVLAYRFPDTPNLGDMRGIRAELLSGEIEAPDVLTGGTPCQAFSVAGLRKGLDDDRGNLSLEFCRIADAIDAVRRTEGKRPCAVLWENVPGVLSDKGNAFGCFLGALCGEDGPLEPPGGKWANAGCVFGPSRTVAWRILDSQFFGVAQRRRRVFVVAGAGAFRPEEVLFERESVRGNPPARGKAGEGFTYDVAPCLGASGRGVGRTGETRGQDQVVAVANVCGSLCADTHPGAYSGQDAYTGRLAIQCATGDIAHALRGEGFDASEDGTGRRTPVVAFEPRFVRTKGGYPSIDLQGCLRADTNSGDGAPCVAFQPRIGRNGRGFMGDAVNALSAQSGTSGRGDSAPCVAIADVKHGDKACNGKGWNDDGTAYTLDTMATQGVVYSIQERACHPELNCGPCGKGFQEGIAYTPEARDKVQSVSPAMQVRRLLPIETERLQALPDNWTLIPWRGKPASECPDGPRYKGIGNGQTVTVMRWLAKRIMREMKRKEVE